MKEKPGLIEATPTINRPVFALGLLVIAALAVWLRFNGLADRELWLDENCTFYWAHHLFDWPVDGPDPWSEPSHLPYFFLLHLWTWVAGETTAGLKSFSALTGCAAVLIVGGVGVRLGGRTAGLAAAALAAVHPLHVYYSQEARCYTLWSVEIALCLYALFEAARTHRRRWWAAYGILAWVTILTHYYALLWLPGTLGAVFVAADTGRCVRQWLKTHIALAVALIPVVWLFILPYLDTGAKGWKRDMWLSYPPALAIPKSLWALLPSGGYSQAYLAPLAVAGETAGTVLHVPVGPIATWVPAVVTCLCLCAFLATLRTRAARASAACPRNGVSPWEPQDTGKLRLPVPPGDPLVSPSRVVLFLLSVSLVFLLAGACQAWIVGQGYIVGRYDMAVWPSLMIVIALLIGIPSRWCRTRALQRIVAGAILTVLLACSGLTLVGLRCLPAVNDATERARRVALAVGPDDLLISVGLYRWFLEHPWHQLGFHPRVLSFPPAHDRQLCWQDAEVELADPGRIAADVTYVIGEIEQAWSDGTRVWLLAQGKPEGPRWEVDRHFFAALRDRGIDVQLQDYWVGLALLMDARKQPASPHDDP